MSYTDVAEYLRGDDRILIPFGSAEQNGPHLPLGSDSLVAEAIACRAAGATGVPVAPAIPWGSAAADMTFAGTISLAPETIAPLVRDVCGSLHAHGFRRQVFVTGHLGNTYALATIGPDLCRLGMVIAQIDVWRLLQQVSTDLFGTGGLPYSHGGAMMTSVMLALRPDLVQVSAIEASVPQPGWAASSYASYPEVMGFAPWEQMAPAGALGDPTTASGAAGEAALSRVVERTIELLDAIRSAP
jgi:creatinine amidohydrolase